MKRRHFIAAAIAAASLSGAYPALAETDQVRVGYIADFWGLRRLPLRPSRALGKAWA
ncbi:hypothetical protein QWZ10_22460 [Paracoccus cavernae]|uniref:ABC transporter substrate-binding protein n=1 Tax=Paracoccus cavernae TaxID=1571207 RepID=A0ABT8DC15_9RHOB|nr:hypothetical protein [Paracoccus cavernae]MDN3713836.1 hypothetical protein [Paracoccus cavernae]